ncbi:hypothetical protein AB5I41_01480 [Sphingomonas sp. MMS24-JH45]
MQQVRGARIRHGEEALCLPGLSPRSATDEQPDGCHQRSAGGKRLSPGKVAGCGELAPFRFLQGRAAFISTDGTAYLLAGTSNGLERFSGGGWSALLTAMSVADRWRFTQFGNFIVAVNGVDTKQVDLTSGAASDLAAAPYGNGVAVVGDFVVITQANGNRLLVQWSAFNDHTAWTAGVDQSGFQPMLTGGEIKGIAGGEYGVILQRFRLVRMERQATTRLPSVSRRSRRISAARRREASRRRGARCFSCLIVALWRWRTDRR